MHRPRDTRGIPRTRHPTFRRPPGQAPRARPAVGRLAQTKHRPKTITRRQWNRLPEQVVVRLVRCRIARRGFRTRQITVATTLLDPKAYPPEALSDLYYRRWQMELALRSIKTTLQMDHLSCKTPQTALRELHLHLLVHNLVRRLMLEAARQFQVPLIRVSFAGALSAARRYAESFLQSRSRSMRRRLREDLLASIAYDPVPDRPGRREPRAVKRRPKPYPLLTRHRHRFREIQHQSRYHRPSARRANNRGLN
jgi:putative transposase